MTRSILLAVPLVMTLGACAQLAFWDRTPAPAPATAPAPAPDNTTSFSSAFVPYCGPYWRVDRQGYVDIPCSPGSSSYQQP